MSDLSLLSCTLSVCPACLRVVDAELVSKDHAVYLEKECPEHGASELQIWPDIEHYRWMNSFSFPLVRPKCMTSLDRGCPRDCGPCVRHLRKPTLVEIEVTQRCNLRCPVCFMSAGKAEPDTATLGFGQIFRQTREQAGTAPGIQLTGGEPTMRRDLPEIVRMGREAGFDGIEVNTNGIVISQDLDYLLRLKEAGLTGIYLQFDGVSAPVYRQVRGADLLTTKLQAIETCRRAGLQVVLAMTVIDGVNLDQIGDVVQFALENIDVVAGLALQPAFTSGRFEVGQPRRLSMGDIIFATAEQCPNLLSPYDFYPLGCAHPLCDCGTYLVRKPDGFVPVTREISPEQYRAAFASNSPQGSVFRDILAARSGDSVDGLSLVIMNYMDATTMDLERLHQCSMVVAAPDGRMLPFCSYHLTGCNGQRIHATQGVQTVPVGAVR